MGEVIAASVGHADEFVQRSKFLFQHPSKTDASRVIAMSKTTVHHVIGIEGSTLIVFHTDAHCWQFRLISHGGTVFGERNLYGEC